VVYKHVIGLKKDSSKSNLGGNTDSNHLIPGGVGHFPSETACNGTTKNLKYQINWQKMN